MTCGNQILIVYCQSWRAGFACQECHGPVQEMDHVYQYSSLKMGWCVSCHRKNLNNPNYPATMDCIACHH